MSWNPDYLKLYRIRMTYIEFAKDPDKAALLRLKYARDPVLFINDWCTTYDPREKTLQFMPFVLFKRQIEFIRYLQGCLNDRESGLVEKSRDVGASWLCCAFSVWLLLFHPGSAVGFGSRVKDDVDKMGDPKCLFEKIRIIINKLPAFLMPKDPITLEHMKIINHTNKATITGGSGDNIGRGGRTSIFFKDESAHYEHPEKIEAALSANTDVQIDISSVNGNGNVFYRKRMAKSAQIWERGKQFTPGALRIFIFDWRDNPMKSQEWYDKRRQSFEDQGLMHIFAQEVDRDYASSVEGIIIPAKFVQAAIDAHVKLKFTPSGAKRAALDVADEGGDKNALAIGHGVILQSCSYWGDGDTGKTARRAVEACEIAGVEELYYDAIGVGAGVKAETNRLREAELLPKRLRVYPWFASASPLDPEENIIVGDLQTPTNEDYFDNLTAQAWWRARIRFEKTWRAVTQGVVYPPDELISIPSDLENLQQLVQELSQVVYKKNKAGKIVKDKKPPGTLSPNLADSVIMWLAPCAELNSFEVMF